MAIVTAIVLGLTLSLFLWALISLWYCFPFVLFFVLSVFSAKKFLRYLNDWDNQKKKGKLIGKAS